MLLVLCAGDPLKIVDDIGALKPTFFIGVPRIFDRIYAKVTSGVEEAGGLKKILYNWGYSRKTHFLAQVRAQRHTHCRR